MKALILDDELYCTDTLALLIQKHCHPPLETVSFTDPNKALEHIKTEHIDLLFLDVEMPLMSGFEFLERATDFNGSVIFTTAYDAYALKAFQVDAVDYLLKPIDKNELVKAVEKVRRNNKSLDHGQLLDLFRHNMASAEMSAKKVAIPTAEGIHMIELKKIIRCESDGSYSTIHIEAAKPLLVSKNLKELEGVFGADNFFRLHKSHLINLKHIHFVSRQDGGDVKMSDGSSVPISRSAKQDFFNRIKS